MYNSSLLVPVNELQIIKSDIKYHYIIPLVYVNKLKYI